MQGTRIKWRDFKSGIIEHIEKRKGVRMCRGQAKSQWSLVTSFHRKMSGLSLQHYFEIVSKLADSVGTVENRMIDVRDNEVNGSFLAYLQHHGFPTPLLDWTMSPYIAAYFAFAEVDDQDPQTDYVSIYVFDPNEWIQDWRQIYDYTEQTKHVTILAPKSMGNKRQIIQQSPNYTFTNVSDIATHVLTLAQTKGKTYLEKYDLSVKERTNIMIELEAMGITAYSLFGTTEALCRYYREVVFRADQVGKTPTERMADFLKSFPDSKK